MGIQSTLNIKRSEAEEKFVNKLLEDKKIMFKKAVKLLSDEELEKLKVAITQKLGNRA